VFLLEDVVAHRIRMSRAVFSASHILGVSVLVLPLGGLAWLTLSAGATPPDSTWIGRAHGNRDLDDVGVLITPYASAVEALPLGVCFLPPAVAFIHREDGAPASSGTCSSLHARAPPAVQTFSLSRLRKALCPHGPNS
jgi:hypothetical protein